MGGRNGYIRLLRILPQATNPSLSFVTKRYLRSPMVAYEPALWCSQVLACHRQTSNRVWGQGGQGGQGGCCTTMTKSERTL